MYIVKFIEGKYLESTQQEGKVQIGTFRKFRNIEENHLRDDSEGAGKLDVKGQDILLDSVGQHFEGHNFNDVVLRFEAGAGTLSGDMSMNCFCYCTCYVDEIGDIEPLRKERFPDKDANFFIADESLFETRCGQDIQRQMKLNHSSDPINVYCFAGKVTYVDAQKETTLCFDNDDLNKPVKVNLAYFFEKPTRFADDQEYRFIWICTDLPIQSPDYRIYSIVDDYAVVEIDPTNCLTIAPIIFAPSEKTISVWDLPHP